VRDAIHDIAEDADDYTETEVEDEITPSPRRSARRTQSPLPPAKPDI
jgi:hypothetical protein